MNVPNNLQNLVSNSHYAVDHSPRRLGNVQKVYEQRQKSLGLFSVYFARYSSFHSGSSPSQWVSLNKQLSGV